MGWNTAELNTVPKQYNCELLFHKATDEQLKDSELPSDTYIVQYNVDNETIYDLCRSAKMTNVFDLYYDRFGNNIRKIEFGYGRKNPKLWGYIVPEQKKRRK